MFWLWNLHQDSTRLNKNVKVLLYLVYYIQQKTLIMIKETFS